MKYSQIYSIKAQKAVESGIIDLKSFVEELMHEGVKQEVIEQSLLDDLSSDGPIFGKFFRSLGMAGDTAISIAELQANVIYEGLTADEALSQLAKDASIGDEPLMDAFEAGDPDALEQLEQMTEEQELTWVCTLRKTCDICLPLHGKSLTQREWLDRGLRPRSVHYNCQCDWVPTAKAESYKEIMEPLTRNKDATDIKYGKRTVRAIGVMDVDRAQAAVAKARDSKDGQRILKLLGQSNKED